MAQTNDTPRPSELVFALSNDDRGLIVFHSEEAAIAYCEAVDVEDGVYSFWDSSGHPLEAEFSKPSERGWFSVLSGRYRLRAAASGASLSDVLHKVAYVEGKESLQSVESVKAHLLAQRGDRDR